jgi:hypothetical protein
MAWAPDYITSAEFKTDLGIVTTANDARIARCITAGARAIDLECNRQFGSVTAEERYYRARLRPDTGKWVAQIDDAMGDVSGLLVENDDGDAITDYRLEPRNAPREGLPFTRLVIGIDSSVRPVYPDYEVAVTFGWGWTAIPSTIKEANHLQASRFFARRESPYGVAGSPDLGNELRLLAKLDADVAVMVSRYVRPRRPA